jgi:hypothetical protein
MSIHFEARVLTFVPLRDFAKKADLGFWIPFWAAAMSGRAVPVAQPVRDCFYVIASFRLARPDMHLNGSTQ